MPSDSSITAYKDQIEILYDLYTYYSEYGHVVIAGDMNASLKNCDNSNPYKSLLLRQFIDNNELCPVNLNTSPFYTFPRNKSTIDYVLLDQTLRGNDVICSVLDESVSDCASDHLNIICTLKGHKIHYESSNRNPNVAVSWHKASAEKLLTYEAFLTSQILSLGTPKLASPMEIETYVNELSNTLIHSGQAVFPQAKFNPHTKPYWSNEVRVAHKQAREKRRNWVIAGKPRGNEYPLYREYKHAKRTFRNVQLKASEEYLNTTYRDIDQAAECDIRLFWKLINARKSKPRTKCSGLTLDNVKYETSASISSAFSKYFEKLFDFDVNAEYDSDFRMSVEQELTNIKSGLAGPSIQTDTIITDSDVREAIKSLKYRKAPGWDNITNEHIIYGGSLLVSTLATIFTVVLSSGYIPTAWKRGVIIPLYKGNNKPRTNPDNYRAITLLPALYKLYEKILSGHILKQITLQKPDFPNKQQHGFQKNLSCLTAALQLQETVAYNLELKSRVYAAFLDTRKAFDTVWHDGLLCKLYHLGIRGCLWRTVWQMYQGIVSAVLVNDTRSEWFPVKQGVRQGGVLSTLLYLIFINDLLVELEQSGYGAKILSLESGCPTLADDLTCLSTSPNALKAQLNIVYQYSQKWRFTINCAKSSVLVFGCKKRNVTHNSKWKLGHSNIPELTDTTHLGILRSSNLSSTERTTAACRKGRSTFYSITNIGARPRGLFPATSVSLYKRVVLPSVLYGCELWSNMRTKDLANLNTFQHFICKRIQGLPTLTRSDMAESMLGVHKIGSEIDYRKLMFAHKLLSLPEHAFPKQIFTRRLYMQHICPHDDSNSFARDIITIGNKYGILSYIQPTLRRTQPMPKKAAWKRIIKRTITTRFDVERVRRMQNDAQFVRFRSMHPSCQIAKIWLLPANTKEFFLADYVARLWVLTPLAQPRICPECESPYFDMVEHALTSCFMTSRIKDTFTNYVTATFGINLATKPDAEFCRTVLGGVDTTNPTNPVYQNHAFTLLCLNYVYTATEDYLKSNIIP